MPACALLSTGQVQGRASAVGWRTGSVDQQHIRLVALGRALRLERHLGGVLLVAALVQRDAQAHAVRLQLLHRAAAEGVAGRNHHLRRALPQGGLDTRTGCPGRPLQCQ